MKHQTRAAVCLVTLLCCSAAWGYGYAREDDPFLIAYRAAITAARDGDLAAAKAQVKEVGWQLDELAQPDDLHVDFRQRLLDAHQGDAAQVIHAWTNLLYLALLQKLHWDLAEDLADYHKARARLDSAQTYYEIGLAGNVRLDDQRRRARDPQAPSRNEDVLKQFALARNALGSPGLLGAGARPADPAAFRAAANRIAGHLKAVFPRFVRPQ